MAIKILIGGSPCTYWSIAQKNNRETEASGMGWEFFKNYLIAREKFKPNYFLYENNKSAAQAIKDQISQELGVDLMYINSALVSAQNRQRFYAFNWTVEQPEDRGILLKDILETGEDLTGNDKSFCLTSSYSGAVAWNTIERNQRNMVAEPVRVGDLPNAKGEISGSQATRIYSVSGKSVNLIANGGGQGAKTGLYAVPATQKSTAVYEVRDGFITIKNRQYPIKLADGFYIIRKLTPIECERLQTLPDNYTKAVSNTQRYKCLGNGWTAEVIIHILNGILKNVPKDEEIIVLSLSMTVLVLGDIVSTKWVSPMSSITLMRLTNTPYRSRWTITPTLFSTGTLLPSVRTLGNLRKLSLSRLTELQKGNFV